MARRSVEPRAIDELRRLCRLRSLNLLDDADPTVALDHGDESFLDHHQHCDHLADALARKILEIACLINADNVVLHILGEAVVVIVVQCRGEGACTVVDGLCRGENLLGCGFHAFNGRAEFAGRARHAAVIAIVDEYRKLAHVAKDCRLDGCQFSRQLMPSLRGLSQFFGDSRLSGIIRSGRRGAATNHLFDAKYFALHAQFLPKRH